MSKKDLFGDDLPKNLDASSEEDFATLLNRSFAVGAKRLAPGDTFRGEILTIGKEQAFISTGTPVDGILPIRELLGPSTGKTVAGAPSATKGPAEQTFKVGDSIEVQVVRVREGEILLRRKNSTAAADDVESLEDAFDMEIPVEGKVLEAVKGGFRVSVQGRPAFCPISQIDLRSGKDAAEYVGKKFDFLITQLDESRRNFVVSRRRVLELKRAEDEGEFLQAHQPGEILRGRVTRLEKFGAFVELNLHGTITSDSAAGEGDAHVGSGIEGLIPISELSWSRVQNPGEIVHIGQDVEVKLIRVVEEDTRLKISLSLKQAGGEGDPWFKVTQRFPVGTIADGTVERKEAYGLFVNLAPGVTGLMPRSKWRDHVDGQKFENKKKGDTFPVQVDQILFEERKLTLAPPDEARDESWRTHASAAPASARGSGAPATGFGTMADLLKDFKAKK